ncbi:3-hydroxybutyryl-CoA dehydrogenase [Pseudomonas sp. RTC3]|uniref:3-hydroxybutyryl-CoA dehydrogenase n=1 Tax=unclassified Pseudomonas TaxID=196821 RepID=UPI002AB5C654|nr:MULTISPECIES: 3-hydroxybutyryl-CoA dehydrogenase [unclassified Pseudomonas]MEB0060688.1 3-hydroxybutyryl-CoA dehydrogenase [Pseudomonas sp. RTC3]MDY7564665.1 3-hydroxybutyryl-CoA dehydrogenase [Pseudomonas sp. 5C2]MEB0006642.1 3-hydroxybutyryl-CoA dehydrogenase [Pseudomonas sp. RTB2]MEB0015980.1 3-hydroxybutyryl-CoA dehydrogenase [Pseudomonas sp. RTB3]MEB0025956.1 3-hydroxybutyryl-CoA dehydrogenase [Pseudomonas sp. MH9.2]
MSIQKLAVIGAGTMGNGIAQVCALAGIDVTLIDISDEALAKGLSALTTNLDRQLRKETITAAEMQGALNRISLSTDYVALNGAELVIEAATENLELKKRILKRIDDTVSDDCVIATNTSSLSITELAAVVKHPARFIGLHFFNPVPMMALLEVIRGLQTSDITHALALKLAEQIGKSAVTARNSPGFVVNRILCPMINEAIFVLQEGLANAKDIDTGMQLGCNHPIGPLALADLIGLDTMLAIMESFHDGFNDPKYRPAQLLKEMVAAGYLGRKSGRGFHVYT